MQNNDRKKEKRIDCISGIKKVEEKKRTKEEEKNYIYTKRKSQSHKFTTHAQQRNEIENNDDGNGMEWLLGRENTNKIRKIEMMIEKIEIRNQAIRHIIEIDKPMEFFSIFFLLH